MVARDGQISISSTSCFFVLFGSVVIVGRFTAIFVFVIVFVVRSEANQLTGFLWFVLGPSIDVTWSQSGGGPAISRQVVHIKSPAAELQFKVGTCEVSGSCECELAKNKPVSIIEAVPSEKTRFVTGMENSRENGEIWTDPPMVMHWLAELYAE